MNFRVTTDGVSALIIHRAVFDYSPITACPQVFYFLHNRHVYSNHLHRLLSKLRESAEDQYCERIKKKNKLIS